MIDINEFSRIGIVISLILLTYFFGQVSVFKVKRVCIRQDKVDLSRDIKIIQVSDYHDNKLIGKRRLVRKIKKINPDIIVLTGDIISDKTTDLRNSIRLLEEIKKVSTNIYSVSGNHEKRNRLGDEFKEILEKMGIKNLEYRCVRLSIDENPVNICGIPFNMSKRPNANWVRSDKDSLVLMLSHSPKPAIEYNNLEYDVVLSGHMHGGQIRLPLLGAVVTPYGGLFPKYNKGLYKIKDNFVYVDSGLGNSSYPLRMFNRVQISYIKVTNKKAS